VWFLREQIHTSDGLWPGNPKTASTKGIFTLHLLFAGNIAIGVGDHIIRLWNVSQPANLNKVTSLWQGIKSKVTAVGIIQDS
jgi:hypothetical protein